MTGEADPLVEMESRLAALTAERDQLWRAQTTLIPVAEVHRELDQAGVPRQVGRRPLFVRERFALLRRKLGKEEE